MKNRSIIGLVILALVVLIALDFGFGYLGVFKTQTVGKAQRDADRKVFESTQSFVKAKVQEATKYRLEYMKAKDPIVKNAIKSTIALGFADFDEDRYCKSEELKSWIKTMKYGTPLPIPIE